MITMFWWTRMDIKIAVRKNLNWLFVSSFHNVSNNSTPMKVLRVCTYSKGKYFHFRPFCMLKSIQVQGWRKKHEMMFERVVFCQNTTLRSSFTLAKKWVKGGEGLSATEPKNSHTARTLVDADGETQPLRKRWVTSSSGKLNQITHDC